MPAFPPAPTLLRRAVPPRVPAERPELPAYALSAGCWAALLLLPPAAAATAFCAGGGDRLAALSFTAGAALSAVEWPAALGHWMLMIGAMMLPMAGMALRHVAFRSFRRRRARAMTGFLLGYGAIWLLAAPAYLAAGLAGLAVRLASGTILIPLGIALGFAAAWQGTAAKRRALRRSHRTVPLPPSGWAADRACLAYGLAQGRFCLASCWALMLVPAAAGHHPLPMLLVGLFALLERRSPGAEPLRRPADAWDSLVRLAPSLDPLRVR
ncbi:MAG TPA: DUF2182 domain-containing protein [Allosphingosinicella sp.]